eukprot:CAMPEP_0114624770 /NCGR_PEP_ID=MMETSP0168-20121206/10933_1 /TAXON_ID=95228 ORGANISM="Vannella sp., Strain DIVA3 517/6/12" /NCGR_SAMPLE_ID=MMETSP0168 /ASSEMBLY_ACC=CAM_ASM_000044 /LENGTH=693 /DNA_ID=CAMNT_0001836045 /DNA_START=35 /DNA_END=2112 /DNA_ORIENTATION=-
MARKSKAKKGLLASININTVLGVVLVALLSFFVLGFFNTEQKKPQFLPGAQFALPEPLPISSDDNATKQKIRGLQQTLQETGFMSIRAELSTTYMTAIQQGFHVGNLDDINWLRALSLFGKNVYLEKPRLPEIVTIAVIYDRLLETQASIATFSEAIDLLETATPVEFETYAAFCYDQLATVQLRAGKKAEAVKTYQQALDSRKDNTFANRWYGKLIETHIVLKEYRQALSACEKCIEELTSPTVVPHNCLHSKGMILAWFGNVEEAVETAISNFDQLVEKQWRRDVDTMPCKGAHFPITYDHFTDEERAAVPGLKEEAVDVPVVSYECSTQQWPKILQRTSDGDWIVGEAQGIFDEMNCITTKEKVPVMYTLENAVVKGEGKIISSDEHCAVYTFGYPYQNSRFHPRLQHKDAYNVFDLPFINVEEAIVLHSLLDQNYFHLLVEGMAMPTLMQYTGNDSAWHNSKIILKAHDLSATMMLHSNVPVSSLQRYDPEKRRYRVKKLHVVDWKFLDTSVFHHPSDYYIPPVEVLELMKRAYTNDKFHDGLKDPVARDTVIFVNRDPSSTRSFFNWLALAERLNATAGARGMEFAVHTGDGSIEEQITLFRKAAAVVGAHGAGLANILFCERETAIIELRSNPKAVTEYSRMSSALGLDYWNVPSVEVDRYEGGAVLSPAQISAVSRTLDYVLFDRG